MPKSIAFIALVLTIGSLAPGALPAGEPWEIRYLSGVPIALPKGSLHSQKIDFAELEHRFPIPEKALSELKPADLESWDQESIDQLYARLKAGPIPEGPYGVRLLLSSGGGIARTLSRIELARRLIDLENLETFLELLWRGVRFDAREYRLTTQVSKKALKAALRFLGKGPVSIPDDGQKETDRFPARVYCGQSLLDSRRESIVVDYTHADQLSGYHPNIDYVFTREALSARTELRMIRPGLYLGRAQLGVNLLGNVIFQTTTSARAASTGPCWEGR